LEKYDLNLKTVCQWNVKYFYDCRKNGTGGPTYEMRWATPEEFMEFKIMPKMLLGILSNN
jgi:hypothetical protein